MTVLLTIFIGIPTFILSVMTGAPFKTALIRMMCVSAFGIMIDLSLIVMALNC